MEETDNDHNPKEWSHGTVMAAGYAWHAQVE
jgi:hypothetical protein